jgi:hypothetical protein
VTYRGVGCARRRGGAARLGGGGAWRGVVGVVTQSEFKSEKGQMKRGGDGPVGGKAVGLTRWVGVVGGVGEDEESWQKRKSDALLCSGETRDSKA